MEGEAFLFQTLKDEEYISYIRTDQAQLQVVKYKKYSGLDKKNRAFFRIKAVQR